MSIHEGKNSSSGTMLDADFSAKRGIQVDTYGKWDSVFFLFFSYGHGA